MRSVAFVASVGVFVRLVCFSSVVGDFWRVVRGALRFACVAFPLVMPCDALKTLYNRFCGVRWGVYRGKAV